MVLRDTDEMIASMAPVLSPRRYVFCSSDDPEIVTRCTEQALATFREAEGVSFILEDEVAARHGFGGHAAFGMITLQVFSALDAVGLTAAVATALTQERIPCNIVAAYNHDHVFIPQQQADQALAALQRLADSRRSQQA